MHFSFIANIALSAACLVWLAVSAYYLFFSSRKQPKITRRISIALAFHGSLIAALTLSSMLSLPQFSEYFQIRSEVPQMISGILALILGLLSISWFLPKALPSYSQREKELETSLSDTTSHLKSLYSLSQQGVMLIYSENFEIQQANNEAKRVLTLLNRGNDQLVLPRAMKEYLNNWLKHGRSSSILNLPSDHGIITLNLDISSFAMEKSPVLLVQFKDIETLPDTVKSSVHLEHSFEVQLIERFDELLNIQATTANELITQLATRLANFSLFDYITVLSSDGKSETTSYQMLSELGQQT